MIEKLKFCPQFIGYTTYQVPGKVPGIDIGY